MTSALQLQIDEPLAIIRLIRPRERNALSSSTLNEIDRAFTSATAEPKITTIAFIGTGDVFASGADIRELNELTHSNAKEFAQRGQQLMQKIADSRATTIAAINGYCMGGALDLALACDARIASPRAIFAHPGLRLGIITGWGGTQRLTKLIGRTRALELLLTGMRLDADEAKDCGLVDSLSEDLETAMRQLSGDTKSTGTRH